MLRGSWNAVSVKWNCRWPELNDVHKLADYCKELKAHDELITLLKVSQVVEQVLEQATLSQGTGAPLLTRDTGMSLCQ